MHKINSKLIKDLNVRSETIKLLEENRKNRHSLGLHNEFYGSVTKRGAASEKITKWNSIKRDVCATKETRVKMLSNHIADSR